jgi:hypothetical protein
MRKLINLGLACALATPSLFGMAYAQSHPQIEQPNNIVFKSSDDKNSATSLIKMRHYGFPTLGLNIVHVNDDGQMVMQSADNRFTVIGQVYDHWEGALGSNKSTTTSQRLPPTFTSKDFAMIVGEGKDVYRLFLTPTCNGCMEAIANIRSTFNPFQHKIELVWLYRTEEDKAIVDQILCDANSLEDVSAILDQADKQDPRSGTSCGLDTRADLAMNIASYTHVDTLPYFVNLQSKTVYTGQLPSNAFK